LFLLVVKLVFLFRTKKCQLQVGASVRYSLSYPDERGTNETVDHLNGFSDAAPRLKRGVNGYEFITQSSFYTCTRMGTASQTQNKQPLVSAIAQTRSS